MDDADDESGSSESGRIRTGDDIDGQPVFQLPSGRLFVEWEDEMIFADSVPDLEDAVAARRSLKR